MNLERDERSGLLYRPGNMDLGIIREQGREYGPLGLRPEDVVIDVGGNIGAFACGPAGGCQQVTSYEPDPTNFAIMQAQRDSLANGPEEWVMVQAAVANETGRAMLYLNGKKDQSSHTLAPVHGRVVVEVATVAFSEVVLGGNVLKVDIEGGEYLLDWRPLAASPVERLAVEMHLNRAGQRAAAFRLTADILGCGFVFVRPPQLNGKHWNTTAVFQR